MATRSTNRIDNLGRLSNGQISKNRRCIQHDSWSIGDSSKNKIAVNISKDKGRLLPKSLENILRNKKILSGNFICRSYVTKAKKLYFKTFVDSGSSNATVSFNIDNNSMEYPRKVDQINAKISEIAREIEELPAHYKEQIITSPINLQFPEIVICDINNMLISQSLVNKKSLNKLIFNIGQSIRDEILDDINVIRLFYNNPEKLANIETIEFIRNRNEKLVSFLLGISDSTLTSLSEKTAFTFAVAIEQLYYLRHHNIVLPHSFISNLIQFYTSGSKAVPVLNGKVSPSGSYPTLGNWMSERGKSKLVVRDGDLGTYFDNIGRYHTESYRVSAREYKKSRIFTTGIPIVLNDDVILQNRSELIPINWGNDMDVFEKQEKMKEIIKTSQDNFSYLRTAFVEKMLTNVLNEGNDVENELSKIK